MNKISKMSKVTLLELPPTLHGNFGGNSSYDIYSKFSLPPRALPTLASVLRKDGWKNVRMASNYHKDMYRSIFEADVLAISAMTRTAPQSMTGEMHILRVLGWKVLLKMEPVCLIMIIFILIKFQRLTLEL